MTDSLSLLLLVAAAGGAVTAAIAAIVLLLRKPPAPPVTVAPEVALAPAFARVEQAMRADLARVEQALRADSAGATAALRAELTAALAKSREELAAGLEQSRAGAAAAIETAREAQSRRLAEFATTLAQLQQSLINTLAASAKTQNEALAKNREETAATGGAMLKLLNERLDALARQSGERLDAMRRTVDENLEKMRQTVDEKLQSTLEKRLAESFKLVGENLEKVMRSLGEMQSVAADVGDLKRVLTNVKTRGTWGEFQLGAILETLLLPDQYAANVKPGPRRDAIVEFAIKLPGRDTDVLGATGAAAGAPLWLPIDSKFPKEDYERLVAAAERADTDAVARASADLARRVEGFARDIRDKYIVPPHTTDFAILFLPTEGLYAEVLRVPGLADKIQRESRVLIAGPTVLAALINSLQMGFRTLAIQKRSSEVWKLLAAIKTQFGTFGDLLAKVQKKLDEAGRVVGDAADKHRAITKRLGKVEALPVAEAAMLLPDAADASDTAPPAPVPASASPEGAV
ncbi:MAG: DNA recombination protein RmuC [Puniceicoccales bacterium]|jgi:DNA recombination protein RmuC|nr:DNA recombination protein RmuC [Puniceicoccales bacterium]